MPRNFQPEIPILYLVRQDNNKSPAETSLLRAACGSGNSALNRKPPFSIGVVGERTAAFNNAAVV